MKKYKIVEVEWLDAQTGFGDAQPVEDLILMEPAISFSVGYLLHKDKKKIILGFLLFDDNLVKHSQLIPMGMVKKMTRLKGVRKK